MTIPTKQKKHSLIGIAWIMTILTLTFCIGESYSPYNFLIGIILISEIIYFLLCENEYDNGKDAWYLIKIVSVMCGGAILVLGFLLKLTIQTIIFEIPKFIAWFEFKYLAVLLIIPFLYGNYLVPRYLEKAKRRKKK